MTDTIRSQHKKVIIYYKRLLSSIVVIRLVAVIDWTLSIVVWFFTKISAAIFLLKYLLKTIEIDKYFLISIYLLFQKLKNKSILQ
jgi:hypothetical protein